MSGAGYRSEWWGGGGVRSLAKLMSTSVSQTRVTTAALALMVWSRTAFDVLLVFRASGAGREKGGKGGGGQLRARSSSGRLYVSTSIRPTPFTTATPVLMEYAVVGGHPVFQASGTM